MNPAAILALIGDLYQQVATLTDENRALREALAPLTEERTSLNRDIVQQGREQAAIDIEKEAAEYEKQYGVEGLGGHAAAVLIKAAAIARTGLAPEEQGDA